MRQIVQTEEYHTEHGTSIFSFKGTTRDGTKLKRIPYFSISKL